VRELCQLGEETGKLKVLVADLPIDWNILREIVAKKL
jgi:hypothetical protein